MLLRKNTLLQKLLTLPIETFVRKMSRNLRGNGLAAICHMRSTNDKKENLRQVCQIVELARQKEAKFLFVPECCDFVGENRKETIELSEPLDGPTVGAYKELAKVNRIWISFGGIHEAIIDAHGNKTNKIYNSHIIIDDCGEIVATYRKLHLFNVDTPEMRFRESDVVTKGEQIIAPVPTPIGNLGMLICYDVRFPEVSTILRKHGAHIILYPSAFAYSTGKAHWEVLLRARAIENQCYVIAPAQIGFHNNKRQSYGHAMIVDPWGQILTQCKNLDLDVAIGEINLDYLKGVRMSMPCFDHRRGDVYSLIPTNISDCLNCGDMKFGEHTIPAETIFYVSEHCFAFTNVRCVVPGHVLVATKRRIKRLKELSGDETADLFATVVTIQKTLESFYETTSSTVTVQDGEEAGQTVKHVHFHVMPRRKGDFKENDEVYIMLNKHDHEADIKRRPIGEMIDEAEQYRKYIRHQTV